MQYESTVSLRGRYCSEGTYQKVLIGIESSDRGKDSKIRSDARTVIGSRANINYKVQIKVMRVILWTKTLVHYSFSANRATSVQFEGNCDCGT